MAELIEIIRDELVWFGWEDHGLDAVECASSTEWADDLAELIADTVSRRVSWSLEITDDVIEAAATAYEEQTGGHLWREDATFIVRAALEAAGFIATVTEVQPSGQATVTGDTAGGGPS